MILLEVLTYETIAALMLVVIVTLVGWFYLTKKDASTRRRMRMIKRLGIDMDGGEFDHLQAMALMKDVRRRCDKCPSEALCERWLAGEVEGDNQFCPNAEVLKAIRSRQA